MSEIVPLLSKAERTVEIIREWLAREDLSEIRSLVVIIHRPDDTFDINWSSQQIQDLAYAGRRLEQEIRWAMDGVIPT